MEDVGTGPDQMLIIANEGVRGDDCQHRGRLMSQSDIHATPSLSVPTGRKRWQPSPRKQAAGR